MTQAPVTETPIGRSLVSGACVLVSLWSVLVCYRVAVAPLDRGVGAAYWATHGKMTLSERIKEIEDNPRMPPQAKQAAIAAIRAHVH